jgi:hypothetical protein
LPELTVSDLREFKAPGIVPERLRKYREAETHRRIRAGENSGEDKEPFDDDQPSKDV